MVLGGSRGIGRAVCLRLAAGGAQLIVHYHRNRDAAEEVAHATGATHVIQADLSQPASIDAAFAQIHDLRLDLLIINAGVWKPSPLGGTTVERMDEIVDTNFKGPFWVMQCALPLLNDGARVVNLSSVAARTATGGGRSLYGATKAAIDSLTRNWAMELAPRGILVNAVAPGYVPTDMTAEHFSDPTVLKRAMDRHPLGRMTSVEDVADVIAFLCSPEARFVTGQSINVSGGFVV